MVVKHSLDKTLPKLDLTKLPQHIAIIMDGNRRWAKKHNLPVSFGHKAGAASVREMVETCAALGIKALTLYALSTENWTRPEIEIKTLMALLKQYLRKEKQRLIKNNIKLILSGDIEVFEDSIIKELKQIVDETKNNTGMVFNLALNYGSRQEIVRAINEIIRKGYKKVDEKMFAENLYTSTIPDPDLLIRTSNEQRISNFLLWQLAYTELYFTQTYWPDFRKKDLYTAIQEYQTRNRRFGG